MPAEVHPPFYPDLFAWLLLQIVVGKEKKFKEVLEARLNSAPMEADEVTGVAIAALLVCLVSFLPCLYRVLSLYVLFPSYHAYIGCQTAGKNLYLGCDIPPLPHIRCNSAPC